MINVQAPESAQESNLDPTINENRWLTRQKFEKALKETVRFGAYGTALGLELGLETSGTIIGGGIRGIAKGSGKLISTVLRGPSKN